MSIRRAGLALALSSGLIAMGLPGAHATGDDRTRALAPTGAATVSSTATTADATAPVATLLDTVGLATGVQPEADLAEAQPVAATRLPGPRPCSFVPSRNAVKPKKNACRFV